MFFPWSFFFLLLFIFYFWQSELICAANAENMCVNSHAWSHESLRSAAARCDLFWPQNSGLCPAAGDVPRHHQVQILLPDLQPFNHITAEKYTNWRRHHVGSRDFPATCLLRFVLFSCCCCDVTSHTFHNFHTKTHWNVQQDAPSSRVSQWRSVFLCWIHTL